MAPHERSISARSSTRSSRVPRMWSEVELATAYPPRSAAAGSDTPPANSRATSSRPSLRASGGLGFGCAAQPCARIVLTTASGSALTGAANDRLNAPQSALKAALIATPRNGVSAARTGLSLPPRLRGDEEKGDASRAPVRLSQVSVGAPAKLVIPCHQAGAAGSAVAAVIEVINRRTEIAEHGAHRLEHDAEARRTRRRGQQTGHDRRNRPGEHTRRHDGDELRGKAARLNPRARNPAPSA